MQSPQKPTGPGNDTEVLIQRVIKAPRESVFNAWTQPALLLKWYAPTGCTISFPQIDVRPGGEYHSCIHIPAHKDCWCVGRYAEVVAHERIVFTMAVADEHGNRISATDAGMDPDWPAETTVTVTLEDADGHTRLTLHQTVSEALAKRTGAHPSWLIMLDGLEALLTPTQNTLLQ